MTCKQLNFIISLIFKKPLDSFFTKQFQFFLFRHIFLCLAMVRFVKLISYVVYLVEFEIFRCTARLLTIQHLLWQMFVIILKHSRKPNIRRSSFLIKRNIGLKTLHFRLIHSWFRILLIYSAICFIATIIVILLN